MVGESGSGKSVTALSITRLVSDPGRIVGGEVLLDGEDILKLDESRMRYWRGSKVSMIFQEPMTALNPVLRVGEQIEEVLNMHSDLSRAEAKARKLLEQCGYFVVRAGGSFGVWDLVALGPTGVRLIQVKSNAKPRPAERERMQDFPQLPYARKELWVFYDRQRSANCLAFYLRLLQQGTHFSFSTG
ncbi:MAG: ABC transporter ATP-binding protein [Chloroflexi bacterium]|nr:ABC transporter ATP-binding protein [Chloroflexota bacterium]